jgi:hypothetical protein
MEGSRKMSQDEMFVLEVLQEIVRAGLAIWRIQPSGERELQLLSGKVFVLNEVGIEWVR